MRNAVGAVILVCLLGVGFFAYNTRGQPQCDAAGVEAVVMDSLSDQLNIVLGEEKIKVASFFLTDIKTVSVDKSNRTCICQAQLTVNASREQNIFRVAYSINGQPEDRRGFEVWATIEK